MNATPQIFYSLYCIRKFQITNSSRTIVPLGFKSKTKSIRPSNLINSEIIGDQQVGRLTSSHIYNK